MNSEYNKKVKYHLLNYLRLLRVKHYIKNFIIFLPLFFDGQLLNYDLLKTCIIGAVCFSLLSSVAYIFNDIMDKAEDTKHSEKCKRPIASGAITIARAYVVILILFVVLSVICYFVVYDNLFALLIFVLYISINVFYSVKLKHIPIVDVCILASGFFFRLLLGSVVTGIEISSWLYLTVTCLSFFMALGKRRNEMKYETGGTRLVLHGYSYEFLDKFMYLCLTLTLIFYSLWVIIGGADISGNNMTKATIPLAIIACMRYCLIIERSSSGDPVEVVFSDFILKIIGVIFIGIFIAGLYV